MPLVSPLIVVVTAEVLFTRAPFWYTSYPVTPTLSVDAFQVSWTEVPVIEDEVKPAGMEGGVVSGTGVSPPSPGPSPT
ncbi:hypothetical protein D3C76_1378860 [compost metagenome]